MKSNKLEKIGEGIVIEEKLQVKNKVDGEEINKMIHGQPRFKTENEKR